MSMLPAALRQSLFIAGTDTGVGKTWVAAALLRALAAAGLRAAGMKPIAAGANRTPAGLRNADALQLAVAGSVAVPYEWLNPCCLERATSPHLAAAETFTSIDLAAILHAYASIMALSDIIIVESAGGWLAPIGDPTTPGTAGPTMQDVAQAIGLPVLLVVGMRLGCISHALLTVDAIRRSGLTLAGWVANPIDPEFADFTLYVESLRCRIDAPLLQLPAASEVNAPRPA